MAECERCASPIEQPLQSAKRTPNAANRDLQNQVYTTPAATVSRVVGSTKMKEPVERLRR